MSGQMALWPGAPDPAEALAPNTARAYAAAWRSWEGWCRGRGLDSESGRGEDVAAWLLQCGRSCSARTGRPPAGSTLRLRLAGVSWHLAARGCASPAGDRAVLHALRALDRRPPAPPRRARALLPDELLAMLEAAEGATAGRDRSLLSLGFAAALRRSELSALSPDDLTWRSERELELAIRRSKTDRSGAGQTSPVIEGRRVRALTHLRNWIAERGDRPGALYLSRRGLGWADRALPPSRIGEIVRAAAARAGVDPAGLSGHSLRAGFVTAAAAGGAPLDRIMAVTRHRRPETCLGYIRQANMFAGHAGEAFL